MQELLVPIFDYLRGIWRFRWLALGVAWALCLLGWLVVAQMPEKYVATARVNIDTNSVLRPLLRGIAIQPDVGQRVALLSKTLLSRPNLEKLMRMTDLDLQAKTDLDKEALLKMLSEEIQLSGDRRNASLYSVSFKHSDRDTAKRVVQSVLTVFIESTLGEKRTESEGAQEFLDQQIKDYEQRLKEAEARRAEFKRRHVGNLPGDSGGYYGKLEQANSQLATAKLALKEAQNRRAQLKRQLADEDPNIEGDSMFGGQEFSPLDARIQSLQAKLDDLLVKYTERHPEVRQIKGLIADLEDQRDEAMDEAEASGEPSAAMKANPVYQQLKNMITATEAEVASLTVRVAEYQRRVDVLKQAVGNIPKIEAEMKQLDRDYKVLSQQYQALVKRRERARLGEKVGQTADDVKFRVIDPPFVPLTPTEPNKLLLNIGVFVVGLGAGSGIALLVSLLRPVFGDRRRLELVTGLPVFGSVSMVRDAGDKRKAVIGGILFASLMLLLLVVFVGINLGHMADLDLKGSLQGLRERLL